jgi:hypothetical protein
MNNVATTASLGLTPIRHNSFTVAASEEQVSIAPEAVDLTDLTAYTTKIGIRIEFASRPKWVVEGAVVKIESVTDTADVPLSGLFVVASVSGESATLVGRQPITLAESEFAFVSGSLTLRCECQRAIISPVSDPVTIAPFADADWTLELDAPYEILAPLGGKFDLATWVYSGGAANVLIL